METSSQQSLKPSQPPSPKNRQSIKTLIVTASLAATLGGWATLATDKEIINKTAKGSTAVAPRVTQVTTSLELPPLPTLVLPPSQTSSLPTPSVVATKPAPQPTLRAVNQPPPMRVVYVGGGDGGGGDSNQGPQAAAQTSSSR